MPSMSAPPGLLMVQSTKMSSTLSGRSGYLNRPLSTPMVSPKPGMLVSL